MQMSLKFRSHKVELLRDIMNVIQPNTLWHAPDRDFAEERLSEISSDREAYNECTRYRLISGMEALSESKLNTTEFEAYVDTTYCIILSRRGPFQAIVEQERRMKS